MQIEMKFFPGDYMTPPLPSTISDSVKNGKIDNQLLDFCEESYWQSLDTRQLIKWTHAISWHLDDPDEIKGFSWTIAETEIDLTGSGRALEDFEDKNVGAADCYDFLCWASARIKWLETNSIDLQPSRVALILPPKVFETLMGPNYWEDLLKDRRRVNLLSSWLAVTAIAIECDWSLFDVISDCERDDEYLLSRSSSIRAQAINGNSCLEVFEFRECELSKERQLTRSSLLNFATWCIAQLRES